jgi:hypothetical protein
MCPGLAITLVDYRKDAENPTVTLAHELGPDAVAPGARVTVVDAAGAPLAEVAAVRALPRNDRTVLVQVSVPRDVATWVAGIRLGAR